MVIAARLQGPRNFHSFSLKCEQPRGPVHRLLVEHLCGGVSGLHLDACPQTSEPLRGTGFGRLEFRTTYVCNILSHPQVAACWLMSLSAGLSYQVYGLVQIAGGELALARNSILCNTPAPACRH